MTKKELIDFLTNARAVPDDAEVVLHQSGTLVILKEALVLFVVDQCGMGCPGGLE